MMKTLNINCYPKTYLRNRKAITFIELMVCLLIASMVFGIIVAFLSSTNKSYMYGVVNLQNLQNARLAINHLRRDFAASCPRIEDPANSNNGYVNLQKIRKQLFFDKEDIPGGDLIKVKEHKLSFYKYVFGSSDKNPKVELITYEYNKDAKTLTRRTKTRGTKVFTGIEDVKFALYLHETNANAPLLWVMLKIHDTKSMHNNEKIGKPLEITTTISSAFINSSQRTKYWRFETGHENVD